MRVFEVKEGFGVDNLMLAERERPECAPGKVLVKMRAAAPNFRDLMMIKGQYNPRQPLPLIPLSDGSGVVEEVGEGVEEIEVGARVIPCFAQNWQAGRLTRARSRETLGGPLDGVMAQWMLLEPENVVEFPDYLSFEEAATLPCAALTAWNALAESGSLSAGEILVCQGTGGVSIFGLQFAKALGAEVIITSSSDEKLQKARELGADYLINYRKEPDWAKIVREITAGVGADHILEVGGGATLQQSLKAARYGGEISVIGVLSGTTEDINIIPILMHNLRVQGIFVGNRDMLKRMLRAMKSHQIRPQIDRVFEFEEAQLALKYLESARHFGKIVIRISH